MPQRAAPPPLGPPVGLPLTAHHGRFAPGPVRVHVSWVVVHWGPASFSLHRELCTRPPLCSPHQQSQPTGSQGHRQGDHGEAACSQHQHSLQDLHHLVTKETTRYYWKGEIQDASEVLMLVKTKTSRIQHVIDYVRSVHPYANPEVLSFPVEDGSLAYMKWMDEAIPDD